MRLERVKRIANCELALCPDYSNRYYPRSSTRCSAGSTLPPGMRFVVILGANRIHVASSTDATSYYAGTGRKLNIVRAPGRASPCASALFPRKIADKPGKNRIVSVGAIEDSDPPVLPVYRFFECISKMGTYICIRTHIYVRVIPIFRLFPPIFRQKVDFESSKVSRGYEICINVFDFIADQFC